MLDFDLNEKDNSKLKAIYEAIRLSEKARHILMEAIGTPFIGDDGGTAWDKYWEIPGNPELGITIMAIDKFQDAAMHAVQSFRKKLTEAAE